MSLLQSITWAATRCQRGITVGTSLILVLSFMAGGAFAQGRNLNEEYAQRINAAQVVGALGSELFGDQTNLYTGVTSLVATDVSLPGNDDLSVRVGRVFKIEQRDPSDGPGLFADWELDIPHLHGVFAAGNAGGWITGDPTHPNQRCSVSTVIDAEPYPVAGSFGAIFTGSEYWFGHHLYVPGVGDQEMLLLESGSSVTRPSDGNSYYWTTGAHWMFSCLATTANGAPGEGFRARSPDGVVYFFDHLVKRAYAPLRKPRDTLGSPSPPLGILKPTAESESTLGRDEVWLLPTLVEDRFGNRVRYTYDSAKPWQLQSITASDGRQLMLTYTLEGNIETVSDGGRTWIYIYSPFNSRPSLTSVQRPDGSRWTLSLGALAGAGISYGPNTATCEQAGTFQGTSSFTGTLTHPSGAVGTFTVAVQRHGRALVEKQCVHLGPTFDVPLAAYPQNFDVLALTSKQISGPGLPSTAWAFGYGPANGSWSEDCVAPGICPGTRTVSVTGPGEFIRYTFGNKFREDEGKLLRVERGGGAKAVLQSEEITYQLEPGGQSYPDRWGQNPNFRSDNTDATPKPLKLDVIAQQGATFSRSVTAFDQYANPTVVTRASSLPFSRSETTTYHHDAALWVLGQVASVTDVGTGKIISETGYDPLALAQPTSFKAFGLLKQTLTYHPDGTVFTVSDGNSHLTTLDSWKRGIPQTITFADSHGISAVVDDLGQISSTTNELNDTTSYTYDAMGRLASLKLPGWTPTTYTFVPVASVEFGLPAGHWRHTETTGSFKKTTYFDGRFRPLLTKEEDTANPATARYTRRAFDHENRETFASYPAAGDPGLGAGSSTQYDALGRVTRTSQTSELGTLTTSTTYLSGFKTRTTNPRGQVTTVGFQAFDSPDTSAPVSILGPAGVSTSIVRDVFGMPRSVTRSGQYNGASVSATRSYVYDVFERLCKRIDPETGGTLFAYDGADNLIDSAEGQSTSLNCDPIPAAARIHRIYDARDRLTQVTWPNAATTGYGYDDAGRLTSLVQGDSAWSYDYNNRGLLEGETLSFGDSYAFTYHYNTLGHLDLMTYPSGLSVAYAPNALGQPTKAGSFASNAQYTPDGNLKAFSYGNGLTRTITQNARLLPQRVRDASGSQVVHDFSYTYDQNGNVKTITDADQAGLQNRSLNYDARDRLTSASAPNLWGVASYAYDPLDNLRVADQGSRQYRYQYDANTNRLTRLTNPAGTPLPGLDFAYDTQGRQVRKGSQTRTFDGANRITAIAGERYAYDGAGRRVATWSADGKTKVEVYTQNGQLAFAVDSQKGGADAFITLAGQRIAQDHWNCASNTHTKSYFHSDALGSPVATTDANRNILDRSYYAPYGEALNRSIDGPGYTGHIMDAATGLVYAQQRYYDPLVGKFLSIDPVAADPGTGGNFNRYWYANDNPYRFTDPDGREISRAFEDLKDLGGKCRTDRCKVSLDDKSGDSKIGPRLLKSIKVDFGVGAGLALGVKLGPAKAEVGGKAVVGISIGGKQGIEGFAERSLGVSAQFDRARASVGIDRVRLGGGKEPIINSGIQFGISGENTSIGGSSNSVIGVKATLFLLHAEVKIDLGGVLFSFLGPKNDFVQDGIE